MERVFALLTPLAHCLSLLTQHGGNVAATFLRKHIEDVVCEREVLSLYTCICIYNFKTVIINTYIYNYYWRCTVFK